VTRLKQILLYALIGIATIAPAATFLGMAIYNELASSNWEDSHFRCYGCIDSFAMVSPTEGWGFGVGPFALHYQRRALMWEPGPDTEGIVLSVAASSPQDIWGVGVHAIWRYDGTKWTNGLKGSPEFFPLLWQSSAVPSNDIWAVGDGEDDEGIIWRYDGSQWRQTDIIASSRLTGVAMVSANDGWAVGSRYSGDEPLSGIFVHYQNGAWKTVATTEGQLSGVTMYSDAEGWAVGADSKGNGVIYRYDGAAWRLYATEPDVALSNVSIANTGDAWALGRSRGSESVVYRHADGKWDVVALPTDIVARSLYVGPDGDIWLAGETQQKDRDGFEQGVVLHDLGGTWQTLLIPHRPPNEPWNLPPQYRFLAETVPVLYVMLFAFWCIGYVRRRLHFHMTNRELRGALKRLGIALLASGLATLLLWILDRDSLDAIPGALVIAITMVLTVLLAFPTIYLAAPPVLMREDGSFRWRRQT
jgi:hypothetical protein